LSFYTLSSYVFSFETDDWFMLGLSA